MAEPNYPTLNDDTKLLCKQRIYYVVENKGSMLIFNVLTLFSCHFRWFDNLFLYLTPGGVFLVL